jgi:hypothetical protein
MKLNNVDSSVFLEEKPSLSTLKACAFFWKSICVHEYFIQTIPDRLDLYDISKLLLEKGILKIAVDDVEDFRYGLSDKVYAGFNREFLEFLYRNADKITIVPKLPSNLDKIVKRASELEYKDKKLHELIDSLVYKEIEDEYLDALHQNPRFTFDEIPKELQCEIMEGIKQLVNHKYHSIHKRFPPEDRYNFKGRNESLLYKFSASSVILSSIYQLPYYYYKFSDFRSYDANRYVKALNATMPFVNREKIDEFSFEDILNIRKNSRWKNATLRLGEICNKVKFESDIKEFEEQVKNEIRLEYQNALDEAEVSRNDLLKDVTKSTILTGISFIPVIGNIISAVGGICDPIVSYFKNVKDQKTLPFFLNDIRKIR